MVKTALLGSFLLCNGLFSSLLKADDPPLPPVPRSSTQSSSQVSSGATSEASELDSSQDAKQGMSLAGAAPVRAALVDSGVNYQLDEINARLAREPDGSLVGYDFWDLDELPFDAHPDEQGRIQRHGTQTASVLLREAPMVELVPYRYPRPDMRRMRDLIAHAASHEVRIIGLPLGGKEKDQWLTFEAAAREHPGILFVASAGNNGRDIDRQPVYPAALKLPNLLVVTSADDFAGLAQGSNWGRNSVDYMVPAESVSVLRFDGRQSKASGSSYAVPRVMALAARMLSADPSLSVTELMQNIRRRFANGTVPRQLKQGYLYDPQFDARQLIEIVSTEPWQPQEMQPAEKQPGEKQENHLQLPLDVLLLDEAWSVEQASRILDEAQEILAFCQIQLTEVLIRRVKAADYLRDLETGAARTLMDAVRSGGAKRQAMVVFSRDTRMSMPYDAEAFGQGNTRSRPWLSNSVWLTLALQDRGIALAHELFHLLVNSGEHSVLEGNLMLARTTGLNRSLTSVQCEQATEQSLSAGLTH